MKRALALLAASTLLAGCTASPEGPGEADVDVDTPALRDAKAAAGVQPCVPGDGEPVEGGLPEVTLPCLGGGEEVDLSSLRGPLVVNLWASWCSPCRDEMPVLQSFHERHADRVRLLGIDYQDQQVDAAMDLVQETGVTYPLLADPGGELDGAAPLPALQGLPFLAFVDDEGRVVHRQFVEIKTEQQLVGLVEEHLGVDL